MELSLLRGSIVIHGDITSLRKAILQGILFISATLVYRCKCKLSQCGKFGEFHKIVLFRVFVIIFCLEYFFMLVCLLLCRSGKRLH